MQFTNRSGPHEEMTVSDTSTLSSAAESPHLYQSYLVRLWRSNPQSPLRATAQCVQTGVINGFADLDALCAFLRANL